MADTVAVVGIVGVSYNTSQPIQNNYCNANVISVDAVVDSPIIGAYNVSMNNDTDLSALSGNSWNKDIFATDTFKVLEIKDDTPQDINLERNNNLVMLASDLEYVDAQSVSDVTVMTFSNVTEAQVKEAVAKNIVWTTATDSGYYSEANGMIRFLFHVNLDVADIEDSGIKFLKTDDITATVDNTVLTGDKKYNAFYGDVAGVPDENTTIYAKAYVKTKDGAFFWSDAIQGTADFNKLFK